MKKFLSYILILVTLIGLFGPLNTVFAVSPTIGTEPVTDPSSTGECIGHPEITDPTGCTNAGGTWATDTGDKPEKTDKNTPFEEKLNDGCNSKPSSWFSGCILKVFYNVYLGLASMVLFLAAYIFNALISIVIQDSFYRAPFIADAWAVVRDLSNIFFILILLYISIKIILDMGGHEAKQMIAKVIVVALLINFSMFFTQVVIDSSNVLALVFYNKLDTKTTVNNEKRAYTPSTPGNERDLSGAMYKNFNATTLLSGDFLTQIRTNTINGITKVSDELPFALTFGIIVISATIMVWAAFVFFVAGIFFLGRLIELWVLIIFSPFAFMSFTIPLLKSVPFVGWDEWAKKLLSTSFMAPIFMFFMYLIFKLIDANIFSMFVKKDAGAIATLLGVIIPALLILALLREATKLAKKGGGVFGELVMTGAKVVGGLALGAATGGAAILGTGALGGLASKIASSKFLNENQNKKTFGGMASRMALRTADYGSKASFDVRKIAGVSALAKMGGVNLESVKAIGLGSKEGGYTQRRKEQVISRQKRAKELEVREDEPLKQALNKTERDLQGLLSDNHDVIESLDKDIEKKRQEVSDAEKKFNAAKGTANEGAARTALDSANIKLDFAKNNKQNFRTGQAYRTYDRAGNFVPQNGTGVNINDLEENKKHAAHAIQKENRERKWAYAERIEKWSPGFYKADREAAHKIRMEAKIEDTGKDHGSGGSHAPAPAHGPAPAPVHGPAPAAPAGGGGGHGHHP